MNDFTPAPNSISYKKLNSLLGNAVLGIEPENSKESKINSEQEKFTLMTKKWQDESKDLLKSLKSNKDGISQNTSPNAMMALGAMEVHINMAIQALRAFETNQD